MQRLGQGLTEIVRRSAGLPFALKALFVAEPGNTHKIIMTRGMEELLRIAAGAAAPGQPPLEPWPRVHALNALRVAYQDASLASETSGYFARGVEESLRAMAAPQWEVRNAATLCYTALLVRILGFRNTATRDAAAKRAMTVADFFAQHPQLHPFLLSQLAAATEQLERDEREGREAGGGSSGGGGRVMHPSLFPVLALLSRLRPSLHSSPAALSSSLSPTDFVPLVRRCAAAEPLAVRQLSARALAPLLAPAELAGAIAELAGSVANAVCAEGQGVAGQATAGAGQGSAAPAKPPANAVHGWLAQLRVLLENAAASDDVAMDELAPGLAEVAVQLRGCVGLCALGQYGCAPLSLEYLRAARALTMLLLAQRAQQQGQEPGPEEAFGGLRELVRCVGEHCWAAICRSVEAAGGDASNPMTSSAYKVATELYFGPLREWSELSGEPRPSGLPLVGEVEVALQSHKYEVRGAALKLLVKLFACGSSNVSGSSAIAEEELPALSAVLLRHLGTEWHHKCVRRTLCLLAQLPPPPAAATEVAGAAATPAAATLQAAVLFPAMLQRAQQEADPAIRQHAVCCLGRLLRPMLAGEQQESSGAGQPTEGQLSAQKAAEALLAVVRDCSQPWELPELRSASVAALEASGLLSLGQRVPGSSRAQQELPGWLAEAGIGSWAVAMRLLEDEDAEIRSEMAAVAAAACASASGSNSSADSAAGPAVGAGQLQLQQGVVAWVEQGVFDSLAAAFGRHPAFVRQLCAWVLPAPGNASLGSQQPQQAGSQGQEQRAEAGAGSDSSEVAAAGGGEGRRLFDKELDNNHEEALLVAQLAARSLSQLAAGMQPDNEAASQLRSWAATALQQLQAATTSPQLSLDDVRDDFRQLYCTLLALWAAGQLPEAKGKAEGGGAWREEMAAKLAVLFGGGTGAGSSDGAGGVLLEQPQLRSLVQVVLDLWGCPLEEAFGVVEPQFEAAFLLGEFQE